MKRFCFAFVVLVFALMDVFPQTDITSADSIPVIPTETDTVVGTPVNEDFSEHLIRHDLNSLYWGKDSMSLVCFYRNFLQLLETREGNLHIMHIGASHVQGGTMSHCIRKHLMDEFGEPPASRGFIFPYSTAPKCNNPYDYRTSKTKEFKLIRNVYQKYDFPLGGSGIAVWHANTPNTITIRMNTPGYDFSSDTLVLFAKMIGNIVPVIRVDTTGHLPDLIDTVNDRYTYYLGHLVDTFRLELSYQEGDTAVVYGFWLKNSRPGITFSSIGVNGAQVSSYLRCENFQRDIGFLHPDLVIFGIGVNDAYTTQFDSTAFQNNYLELVRRIREVNPDCAFIFISNNDTWKRGKKGHYTHIPTGPVVSRVMHRLADLTGGACWDQFTVMGGERSMAQWQKKGLAQADRVHFTASGYNLIGDLFYAAFIREIRPVTDELR